MNTARNIAITLTLAAMGLSGAAQAREDGGRDRMQHDSRSTEQRAARRAPQDRVASRHNRREQQGGYRKRDSAGSGYGRVDRRQEKQRARLTDGRHSGELSRGEFHRLKKEQKKIGRMEHRYSADGYLSGKERRRLERAQDRASHHIARAKHNDLYRGSKRYGRSYDYAHRGSRRYAHSYKQHRHGYNNRNWDY